MRIYIADGDTLEARLVAQNDYERMVLSALYMAKAKLKSLVTEEYDNVYWILTLEKTPREVEKILEINELDHIWGKE